MIATIVLIIPNLKVSPPVVGVSTIACAAALPTRMFATVLLVLVAVLLKLLNSVPGISLGLFHAFDPLVTKQRTSALDCAVLDLGVVQME